MINESSKLFTFFFLYSYTNSFSMSKTKKIGKTMREDGKGNRTGKYGNVRYSSKKRRSKPRSDDYGFMEW